MHDDQRRSLATLVRLSHLGAEDALAWRRLLLDGLLKHAGQFGRRKLGECSRMRRVDGPQKRIDTLTAQRRNGVHPGKGKEAQLAVEFALNTLAVLAVEPIPLVDRDDERAAGFNDEAGNVGILFGNLMLGVDHQQHHVAGLDGLKRLDD